MKIDGKTYETLLYYGDQDFINQIPNVPGNYFWVHYVNIDENISIDELSIILREYSTITLDIPEEGMGTKYFYKIGEMGFHNKMNSILGLKKSRENILLEYLADKNNLKYFISFFKELCFKRPFYVGKAIKLRDRIKNHVNGHGNSPIIKAINSQNIDKNHIWIGYEPISAIDEEILNIFEEITQIKLKPGLTKKFG